MSVLLSVRSRYSLRIPTLPVGIGQVGTLLVGTASVGTLPVGMPFLVGYRWPMATNRLTDTKCKQAAAKVVGGERRPAKIYDGEGLFLYCTAAGAKVWRLDYRDEGRPQTETFGPYPLLSLADARQKRIDFKKALLNGPPAEPAVVKASKEEITFRQAWTDYLAYRSTDLSVGVRENFRRGLEMHVEPFLGDRLLREITDADMRSVLLRLDAAGKLSYVRKVRKWCGQVFAWAKPRGHCDVIPTREIDPKLEFRKKKEVHYPSLPLPEVHEFMGRLALERPELQSVLACQLLALTWVRTTNLRSMEWAEIDGDIWRIPEQKMLKNDRAHLVPLCPAALKILGMLRAQSRGSKYVFPGDRSTHRRMSENAVLALIYRMGYKDRMSGHGWRTIASTWANEAGFGGDAIELQLNHVESGVRGVYNQAKYLPERTAAISAFADWLYQTDTGRVEG